MRPQDNGWAWMVLLGTSLQLGLTLGVQKSTGILFVAIQERFHATAALTSLVYTLKIMSYCFTAPLVMTAGLKVVSCRTFVMSGSLLLCFSHILTSVARNIHFVLFSHGILHGIGIAFIYGPSFSIIGQYFDRKIGLANSLAVGGVSIGGMLFPPLITYLLKAYGFQGSFLLLGSFLLHGCIGGALMRPIAFYDRKLNIEHPLSSKSAIKDTDDENTGSENIDFDTCIELLVHDNTDTHNTEEETSSNKDKETNDLVHGGLQLTMNQERDCVELYDEDKENSNKLIKFIKKMLDINILKNPMFIAYEFCVIFLGSGNLISPLFVAPWAKENGINKTSIAALATFYSISDLLARIVLGFVADKKYLRRSTMAVASSTIVGISGLLLELYTTYTSVVWVY